MGDRAQTGRHSRSLNKRLRTGLGSGSPTSTLYERSSAAVYTCINGGSDDRLQTEAPENNK